MCKFIAIWIFLSQSLDLICQSDFILLRGIYIYIYICICMYRCICMCVYIDVFIFILHRYISIFHPRSHHLLSNSPRLMFLFINHATVNKVYLMLSNRWRCSSSSKETNAFMANMTTFLVLQWENDVLKFHNCSIVVISIQCYANSVLHRNCTSRMLDRPTRPGVKWSNERGRLMCNARWEGLINCLFQPVIIVHHGSCRWATPALNIRTCIGNYI